MWMQSLVLNFSRRSQRQQSAKLEIELRSRINRIREAGLIKRWKEVFWPRNDECDLRGSGDANVIKVFLNDMQGSFYILGMGKYLTLNGYHLEQDFRIINTTLQDALPL